MKTPLRILIALSFLLSAPGGYAAGSFFSSPFEPLDFAQTAKIETQLAKVETKTPDQWFEFLTSRFFLAGHFGEEGKIHLQQRYLRLVSERCEALASTEFSAWQGVDRSRMAAVCLMNEAEWINYRAALGAYFSASGLDTLFKYATEVPLPLMERLYFEGRTYSALPKLYGQNLKKALVSLQMLVRLQTATNSVEDKIQRIRLLQGNAMEEGERPPLAQVREITDGRNFGFFPMLYGSTPQGIGAQIRIQDEGLFDTPRSLKLRAFGTHRGSLGAEWRLEDASSIEDTTLVFVGNFLYGVQQFHGLGIHSAEDSTDVYHVLGRAVLAARKQWDHFNFSLGWRVQAAHLRNLEGGPFRQVVAKASSNTFDSGPVAELGLDTRDSVYDPYQGRWVTVRGFFPAAGILSSESYQKWAFSWDEYLRLGLRYTLRLSAALQDSSVGTPYWDFSQLSGTVGVPGIALARFQEHDLWAAWAELRVREWDPVTSFLFLNMGSVGADLNSLFRETVKAGFGAGAEVRLTRFRLRAVRAEAGMFGSELVLKASLGVPID